MPVTCDNMCFMDKFLPQPEFNSRFGKRYKWVTAKLWFMLSEEKEKGKKRPLSDYRQTKALEGGGGKENVWGWGGLESVGRGRKEEGEEENWVLSPHCKCKKKSCCFSLLFLKMVLTFLSRWRDWWHVGGVVGVVLLFPGPSQMVQAGARVDAQPN